MVLKGEVKIDKALRKLGKLQNQVTKKGNATVDELAEIGKWKAKSIVPYFTGKTYNFIRARKRGLKGNIQARVEALNPTKSDGHKRSVANFNLVRWMHESPKARRHIISGDNKFMYTTRTFLNKIKTGVAKGKYRNINLR